LTEISLHTGASFAALFRRRHYVTAKTIHQLCAAIITVARFNLLARPSLRAPCRINIVPLASAYLYAFG